jgi:hypothetical protein
MGNMLLMFTECFETVLSPRITGTILFIVCEYEQPHEYGIPI